MAYMVSNAETVISSYLRMAEPVCGFPIRVLPVDNMMAYELSSPNAKVLLTYEMVRAMSSKTRLVELIDSLVTQLREKENMRTPLKDLIDRELNGSQYQTATAVQIRRQQEETVLRYRKYTSNSTAPVEQTYTYWPVDNQIEKPARGVKAKPRIKKSPLPP